MSFVPLGARQEDEESEELLPTRNKVISLLNEAQLGSVEKSTLNCLHQVKELIINKDPNLLDSFLDEVIAFQVHQSADVRKFIVAFMEDACKTDAGMLVRVVPMLSYMMDDNSVNVIKRLLVCIVQLYKIALIYVSKIKVVDDKVQDMWETFQELKSKVYDLVESENDGVRTIAIKFMEVLILAQTKKEPTSEQPRSSEVDVSLDIIPLDHPLLKPAELREEAGTTVCSLLALVVSPTISSVNLMTAIGCLTNIAKQRPVYISTVLQSFELLHANLPPHFGTSQMTSVRKQLKTQVLSMLRFQSSFEFREHMKTLLTDLGCTQAEIAKNTPKASAETLKRARVANIPDMDTGPSSKRPRINMDDSTSEDFKKRPFGGLFVGRESKTGTKGDEKRSSGTALMEAIEMTTADIKPFLTPETVTELVMTNMKHLPSQQPKAFRSSYTPIAAAGTDAQVTHLARLLASQMTSAGIGIGAKTNGIKPQRQHSRSPSPLRSSSLTVSDPRKRTSRGKDGTSDEKDMKRKSRDSLDKDTSGEVKPDIIQPKPDLEASMAELTFLGNLLGLPTVFDPMFPLAFSSFFGGTDEARREIKMETDLEPQSVKPSNLVAIPTTPMEEGGEKTLAKKEKRKFQPLAPQKLKKIRMFNLSTVVKPLPVAQHREMTVAAFKRILDSEKTASQGAAGQARIKLIIGLVTQFGEEFNTTLLEFILSDLRNHMDLAIAWLFTEYSISEGYLRSAQNNFQYDWCLTSLLHGTKEKLHSRDRLLTRLMLEAPRITPRALQMIKSYCKEEERAFLGITTLKELISKRPHGPNGTEDFLEALLDVTTSDIELARVQALHIAKKLYTKPELASKIERFALNQLQHLISDHPTFLQEQSSGDIGFAATDWSEDTVKMCLSLFLSLLPLNHKLLKDMTFVYTSTSGAVKRIIHSHLDQPVSMIGMDSPELLQLVESCPLGGETLIMRMLHILTDSSPPSAELVKRVRELYHRNSSDVRFLIPVLHGLQKQEVISALPKFIRLSPGLVKSVFDRLLVSYKGDQGRSISPVSPSELLIALHKIDCTNDDSLMKAVVKATNLCFQEKSVYTQEVLAVVLQQLLEQTPIPMLFMRTVLQSLGVCPKLMNFVVTILTKLISKQIWKQPKVWQGFIKCCEVTKSHSFQVLLQLPPRQLENVLELSPQLREPLSTHVQNLTPHQRACIPRSLLQIIEKVPDTAKEGARKTVKKTKGDKTKKESSTKRKPSVKNEKDNDVGDPA